MQLRILYEEAQIGYPYGSVKCIWKRNYCSHKRNMDTVLAELTFWKRCPFLTWPKQPEKTELMICILVKVQGLWRDWCHWISITSVFTRGGGGMGISNGSFRRPFHEKLALGCNWYKNRDIILSAYRHHFTVLLKTENVDNAMDCTIHSTIWGCLLI